MLSKHSRDAFLSLVVTVDDAVELTEVVTVLDSVDNLVVMTVDDAVDETVDVIVEVCDVSAQR